MFQIREGVTLRIIDFSFLPIPRTQYVIIETGQTFIGYTGFALEDYLSWRPEERHLFPWYCALQKEFKINHLVTVIQTPHEDNRPANFGIDNQKFRYKVVQTDDRFIGSTGDPWTDYYAYNAHNMRTRSMFTVDEEPMDTSEDPEPMDTSEDPEPMDALEAPIHRMRRHKFLHRRWRHKFDNRKWTVTRLHRRWRHTFVNRKWTVTHRTNESAPSA